MCETIATEYILIVDDQDDILDVVSSSLEYYGYRTFCTVDPKQALIFADDHAVLVLLTDLVMPEMSGEQLAIRMVERHPNVKVLVMTGYCDHSPPYPVLYKPFRTDELLGRIQALSR